MGIWWFRGWLGGWVGGGRASLSERWWVGYFECVGVIRASVLCCCARSGGGGGYMCCSTNGVGDDGVGAKFLKRILIHRLRVPKATPPQMIVSMVLVYFNFISMKKASSI